MVGFRIIKSKLPGKRAQKVHCIKEHDYELIVGTASAVLMCLCQLKAVTLDEVSEHLCSWGIRLSTSIVKIAPPRMSLRAAERIPYRVKGFQLGIDDYMSYEEA
ncbi:uncharacterized protein ARMOST_20310 [Armillaria ostoyae]|uniref:Uncharacterized protein n=1 Tax=Armillaria ostoyae TaxID=47428 RepID=A0A284S704_ARMOS|nr:uncharacterized protein ARMOST_07557 [Armillaria ostoyae]SJL16781.1 uncharacterized protein ARMOST_20310 [Armillaria ostoyae]